MAGGLTPEAVEATRDLRLKLKAARGLIRDLLAAAAECERQLTLVNAEPQEAEHDDDERYCAAA